jgi:plastocyanin
VKKIIFLFVITVVFYFILSGKYLLFFVSSSPTIKITDNGFRPQTVYIKKGTTVKFVNTSKKAVWPASDAHPVHDLLREFDPQKQVDSGESWTFNFDKVGIWSMHDHITPSFTGKIVVLNHEGKLPGLDDCNKYSDEELSNCLSVGIQKIVKKHGISAGFKKLSEMENVYSDYSALDCHEISHFLGKSAFEENDKGEINEISPEIFSMCGYGFLHGYVDALVGDERDVSEAKEFCKQDFVSKKTTCHHGVGHAVFDSIGSGLIGNEEAMVNKSVSECRRVFDDDNDAKSWCFDGVFNALAVAKANRNFNLSFGGNNPLEICDSQPPELKRYCYPSVAAIWITNKLGTDFRLDEAFALAEKNINYKSSEFSYIPLIVQEYFKQEKDQKSDTEIFNECVKLKPDNSIDCLKGVSGGILATSPQGVEERVDKLCTEVSPRFSSLKTNCNAL